MAEFNLAALVSGPRNVNADSESYCQSVLERLNKTLLMLLVTPVLFLLSQVKMSAMKRAYYGRY